MICKNANCNFAWHCFVRAKDKNFVPPCKKMEGEIQKRTTHTEGKQNDE